MSLADVKSLTLFQVSLFTRSHDQIGIQKMPGDEAVAYLPPEHNPKGKGKGKKFAFDGDEIDLVKSRDGQTARVTLSKGAVDESARRAREAFGE